MTHRRAIQKELRQLAHIRLGKTLPSRSALASEHVERKSKTLVIQPSSIDSYGRINWKKVDTYWSEQVGDEDAHPLMPGAILLLLRGPVRTKLIRTEDLHSTLIDTEEPRIVASSSWAIIETNPTRLEPEYLEWRLNTPTIRQYLESQKTGSAMQYIPLSAIQKMKIDLPPVTNQRAISRAADLLEKMTQLERQRADTLRLQLLGLDQASR
jgi:hypothetical protein